MRNSIPFHTCAKLLLASSLVGGCSDGEVDIGDNNTTLQSGLAAYAATWVGYIEAYTFASGSDRVELAISEDGTGHIRFGERELLPVPTDPDVVPEFVSEDPTGGANGADGLPGLTLPAEGFEYPLSQLRVEDKRLRTEFTEGEVYASWCELQTSYLVQLGFSGLTGTADIFCLPGAPPPPPPPFEPADCDSLEITPTLGYSCIPGGGGGIGEDGCFAQESSSGTPVNTPVDCAKLELCPSVCSCDENGCSATGSGALIQIDGALQSEASELEATILLQGGRTLRLNRE